MGRQRFATTAAGTTARTAIRTTPFWSLHACCTTGIPTSTKYQTALLTHSVKVLTLLFTLICSLRYLNKPRSSWNLCMRSPCWMSSSSTHVCMNIASLSAPPCVSVSSFSRCGLTCSAAERPLPKTSDEGRLVVTGEGRIFLVVWYNKKGN